MYPFLLKIWGPIDNVNKDVFLFNLDLWDFYYESILNSSLITLLWKPKQNN